MNLKVRAISTFLALLFSLEQVSFAASELKPKSIDVFEKPAIHFKLPESVASVEDAWKAPGSDKLVYLIQDAHTNNSGQINLSKTLDILLRQEARGRRQEGRGKAEIYFCRGGRWKRFTLFLKEILKL